MRTASKSSRVNASGGGEPGAKTAEIAAEPRRRWMIQKILVPVDFSGGCKAAYEFSLDLAEQYDARVHLLHVVENLTTPDFESFPLARNRETLIARLKKELVSFAQHGGAPVVPVYPAVRVGSPWEQIIDAAADDDIDLIIIPTHGYTGLKRLVIGSVAERVVRHAPCPVLAVRTKNIDTLRKRSKTPVKSARREESL